VPRCPNLSRQRAHNRQGAEPSQRSSEFPGFPLWAALRAPIVNHDFFRMLAREAPGAHAFEAKVFNIVSSAFADRTLKEMVAAGDKAILEIIAAEVCSPAQRKIGQNPAFANHGGHPEEHAAAVSSLPRRVRTACFLLPGRVRIAWTSFPALLPHLHGHRSHLNVI
jgi:hypothetical protein